MFTINKIMTLVIASLVTALLLSGCSEDYKPTNLLKRSSQAQVIQKQSVNSHTIQKEKPKAPDNRKPTSNEYNSSPPQARVPYPSIPDEPENSSKEAQ